MDLKESIRADIRRAVPDIARKNNTMNDVVESILCNDYNTDDDFTIVLWPEIQDLMDKPGYEENVFWTSSSVLSEKYKTSVWFVNKNWLNGHSK